MGLCCNSLTILYYVQYNIIKQLKMGTILKLFRVFYLIILITIINSCTEKKTNSINTVRINIDISKASSLSGSLFNKIEITQLETNDSSIFGKLNYVKYVDDKYFIIVDNKLVVYIFDKFGSFVSNSKKCFGNGPKEYLTITDATYNKYTDQFDLLDYDKKIVSYDKKFNYIGKTKIKSDKVNRFTSFLPINKSDYILTPSCLGETNMICFYDTKNEKMNILNFEGNISKLTMTESPLTTNKSGFIFSPSAINYSIFSIDINKMSLKPTYVLDVMYDRIDEKVLSTYKSDRENSDFLAFNSNYVIPVRNLVSEKNVMSMLLKNKELYTNIYCIETGKNEIVKNINSDFTLPQFFAIQNNVLYALVYPFEVEKYINKNNLDSSSIKVLNNTNDELNPLIVKYYLK